MVAKDVNGRSKQEKDLICEAAPNTKKRESSMKAKQTIISCIGITALLILSCSATVFCKEINYKTKTDFICDDTKIEIITKYFKFTSDSPPHSEEQTITLKDIKTGISIETPSSGKPYDKDLDATSADGYQCVKGKKQSYLVLSYRTGGNCVECEWQGILDLKGNRIVVDRYKKQKSSFAHKWKELGLHGSPKRGIDFEAIPDE
ncbi:MAG: hypothetical protein PHP95_17610 [Desulfuromonadaceae bacterium]|nr:hypothetical protein [Desulfobulbus sp.]MDD2850265.1 hypothetical protein [Desulfuromonadaceae bacterium]